MNQAAGQARLIVHVVYSAARCQIRYSLMNYYSGLQLSLIPQCISALWVTDIIYPVHVDCIAISQ